MDTTRLAAFSDGVFAIAITLLVLEVKPPHDTHHLLKGLLHLWPSYLAYVVSFLLIGLIWANHHAMFGHIHGTDRVLLLLNTLLLMNVAFLPFVASVLAAAYRDGAGERTAVTFYGISMVVGGVLFNAVWLWARREHELIDDQTSGEEVTGITKRFIVGPLLYAVGTGLGLLLPVLGLAVFAGLILFYWLPVSRREQRGT